MPQQGFGNIAEPLWAIVTYTVPQERSIIQLNMPQIWMYWHGANSHSIRDEYAPICPVFVGASSVFGAYSGPFLYGNFVGDNRSIWRNECFMWSWTCPTSTNMPQTIWIASLGTVNLPHLKRRKTGHIQVYLFQFLSMNASLNLELAPLRRICPNQFQIVLTNFW